MPTKKQVIDAGKFFLLLVIVFAVLLFVSTIAPENFFEKTTAKESNIAYGLIGVSGTVTEQDNQVFIEINQGPRIYFSALCTGLLETILLVSAIAATFEISWKKRLFGIIVSIISIAILNVIRITATTFTILNTGIQTAEFTHDILFRIFLFIAIAGLYAGWYKWATIPTQ